jgi:hypothetical protein
MPFNRPKSGGRHNPLVIDHTQRIESRWGRHFGWQIQHSGEQSIECHKPLKNVPAPFLVYGREAERTDQQRT